MELNEKKCQSRSLSNLVVRSTQLRNQQAITNVEYIILLSPPAYQWLSPPSTFISSLSLPNYEKIRIQTSLVLDKDILRSSSKTYFAAPLVNHTTPNAKPNRTIR